MKHFLYLSNVMSCKGTLTKAISVAAAVGFGLGLSACSNDAKTAGGGPSGTEAGNAIIAQIYAGNTAAAHARVKLIDRESIDGTKDAYTAETDENGSLRIENVSNGSYTLEAALNGEALQVSVDVNDEEVDLGSAKLAKTATVSGTIDAANGTVKVRGMDHGAAVVNGAFDIDSLPAGPLSLVFVPSDESGDTTSSYIKTLAGEKAKAATFADESVYLLLEDFQDSNYQNRFMPAHTYDGGWWYFDCDENNVTTKYVSEGMKFALENEDGNISAHAAASFGEVYTDSLNAAHWPWAMIGVELGKSDKKLCNDISSVDSIAFRTKGSGNIVFTLVDETQKEGEREILTFEFALSENWDRYSIPLKGLIKPGYSLTCVNQLAWKLSSAAVPATEENPNPYIEIWLDDVQLIGGDRLTIWEK